MTQQNDTVIMQDDAQIDLRQLERNRATITLLRSWREDDEQEQRETLEYLKRVLDEDRLSDRPLFQ